MTIPSRVAEIRIPDSATAKAALEHVREISDDVVFNHVMRTYLFGALLGKKHSLRLDLELFFLGAVMHDVGQTDRWIPEPGRFEVVGADAAAQFLRPRGYPEDKVEVVWDAIVLHTSRGIVDRKRPEIALVAAGAAFDVAGARYQELSQSEIREVIGAFPRPQFKKAFTQVMAKIARQKPETTYGNLLWDVGHRHVEGFCVPGVCELIEAAPFEE